MNIFVIHSGKDYQLVSQKIANLKRGKYNLNALALKNGNFLWKLEAAKKIKLSQMVVFYVGEQSHESPYIAWEIKTAIKYKKPIYTVYLEDTYHPHPALSREDAYSGEMTAYDKRVEETELMSLIQKYEAGDYAIFNTDPDELNRGLLLEQYKSTVYKGLHRVTV